MTDGPKFDAGTQMQPTGQELAERIEGVAEDIPSDKLNREASKDAIFPSAPVEPAADESAVPLSELDETSKWTPEQSRMAAGVYQKIAELLPTEGRDYDVFITFKDGSASPSLSLRPMTPIGKAFIEHVYNTLATKKK